MRRVGQQRNHFIQRVAQWKRDTFQNELTGFQLGEVEHVINDRQQIIRGTLNGVQMVTLGGVQLRF
ncbi:hypothetical protein NGUA15_04855 [Salmonella enterica]|nr:hypothetical protein NGUA15_04855 [Salmonella enterica]